MSDYTHETSPTRQAIAGIVCNVFNWPDKVSPHLLGRDLSEVLDKIADAVGEVHAKDLATARRDALNEAADAAFKDKSVQGLQRVLIGNWLRSRAAS